MEKNINIMLDEGLWRAVKVEAARQGKSVKQLVQEILQRNVPNPNGGTRTPPERKEKR